MLGNEDPYLVVSGDSHAGPSLDDLRPYCPARYVDEFDAFAAAHRAELDANQRAWASGSFGGRALDSSETADIAFMDPAARAQALTKLERVLTNPGSIDPHARLADMDEQGITSELVFAGAQNRHILPWAGGTNAGSPTIQAELRAVGGHIWNAWLADFCSAAPERLLGVAQIPIWDVGAAVEEIRWAKDHGLRAINFPAPRPDYPAYNVTSVYEDLWNVVEAVDLPLVTHTASGETASGGDGEGAVLVYCAENLWLSRRGLSQLIFGKVFDRHPRLTVAFVEQRANWVVQTLEEFDSQILGAKDSSTIAVLGAPVSLPQRMPSDYWRTNCVVADSFMAPFEAALRNEIGVETMLWGSDYPHMEGTWPLTHLALRNTFAGVPHEDVRAILGTNAVRIFNLDTAIVGPVAQRVGPSPADVDRPLTAEEMPAYRGLSFRRGGTFH